MLASSSSVMRRWARQGCASAGGVLHRGALPRPAASRCCYASQAAGGGDAGERVAITLLHNPNCSKSRAAHDLLAGVSGLTVRLYIEQPLDLGELQQLAEMLGPLKPREWARKGSLSNTLLASSASDSDILEAMAASPAIIERPIAIDFRARRAVVGRPPATVLELLP